MRTLVCITHFNRPHLLSNLLSDLQRERERGVDLDVQLFDDCSSLPLPELPPFVRVTTAPQNHGKHRYREWVSYIYGCVELFRERYDRFCFMPDDIRLCERFFDHLESRWEDAKWHEARAGHAGVGCLTYVVDDSMDGKSSWTGAKPVRMGSVTRTSWVDGAFYAERGYFDALAWRVPKVSWRRSETLGSGLGAAVSCALHQKGLGMYHVHESLACRVQSPSLMNPHARRQTPLITARFVDGFGAYRKLSVTEPVTCALASVPSRVETLERAVVSLRGQCDRLCVYLNGYEKVPEFLDGVAVARSQDCGDRGDAGKFFWACAEQEQSGYYLSCDDDIVYPPDYVVRMTERIEAYGREAVISYHGAVLPRSFASYYRGRTQLHCKAALREDRKAHVPGTGVMGFWWPSLALQDDDFVVRNAADVNVAVVARRQGMPVFVAQHEAGWLKTMDVPWDIYSMRHKKDPELTQHLRTVFGPARADGDGGGRKPLMGAFGEVWRRQPPALWDRMWASRKGERITEHLVSMCLESQSVIEIGCGYGHFVKEVLQRNWTGERYIGIDISAGPLKMQGLDPRVTAVRGDFMSILAGSSDHPDYGLLDTKVDLIISQAVLCHQAHWLPMFLAAKSRAKRVAMDISYVTDEPMHRPKRREDGCYDTYTSEKQLREEIAALELPIKVHRMKNVKRNRDELLLVM